MSPGTAAAAGTKRTARVAPVSGLVRSLAAAQSSASAAVGVGEDARGDAEAAAGSEGASVSERRSEGEAPKTAEADGGAHAAGGAASAHGGSVFDAE